MLVPYKVGGPLLVVNGVIPLYLLEMALYMCIDWVPIPLNGWCPGLYLLILYLGGGFEQFFKFSSLFGVS